MHTAAFQYRLLSVLIFFLAFLLDRVHADPATLLEYKVEPDERAEDVPINMQSLIDVINRRLEGAGIAKTTGENILKVEILEDVNEDALKEIRRSIETVGDLQFRITAQPSFVENHEIIEAAKALSKDQDELWVGGKKVAQWIPYEERGFGTIEQVDHRIIKRKAGKVSQALVLMNDGFDVTGKYIESCSQGIDETGNPQVNFKFNDQGAFRFGQLTSTYLPHDGRSYSLAIIFNNKILTAPTIRSKITHQGRISGLRDMKEVDFIVSILNAGSLTYPIRLISERSAFRTWSEE